ncbi:MAG: sulfotransferase [Pseudomonadota bacterium]
MPVCIAGMHRSGTSMVTRLLNLCGLYLGPSHKMLPAQHDNPLGFWENTDFNLLNEGILSAIGGKWDQPSSFSWKEWESNQVLAILKKTADKVVQVFVGLEPWGWKDPRNCLTLAFWNGLFLDLKVVVCLRNPLAVAHSLQKRNGFSVETGLRLWSQHYQNLLASSREDQRIVVEYEAFFVDPGLELRRLVGRLGWEITDKAIEQALKTISLAARHHSSAMTGLGAEEDMPDLPDLYSQMQRESRAAPEEDPDRRGHFSSTKTEDVVSLLRDALNSNPEDSIAFRNLIEQYLVLKRPQEAIAACEQFLVRHPADVEMLLMIGNICCRMGRPADAAFFYKRVMDIQPENAMARERLESLGACRT